VNDDQLSARSLDCENLDGNTRLIVTEEQAAIRFRWIVWWRLVEGQAAVSDDLPNLIIAYAMPAGGLQNPDRQLPSP
jgi:hypothetical protein